MKPFHIHPITTPTQSYYPKPGNLFSSLCAVLLWMVSGNHFPDKTETWDQDVLPHHFPLDVDCVSIAGKKAQHKFHSTLKAKALLGADVDGTIGNSGKGYGMCHQWIDITATWRRPAPAQCMWESRGTASTPAELPHLLVPMCGYI